MIKKILDKKDEKGVYKKLTCPDCEWKWANVYSLLVCGVTRILAGLFRPADSTEFWQVEPTRPTAAAAVICSWLGPSSAGSVGGVDDVGGELVVVAASSPVDLIIATGLAIGAGGGGGNIELG